MSEKPNEIRIQEVVQNKGDKLAAVEYIFNELLGREKVKQYRVTVKKEAFDDVAATIKKWTIPFDSFITVARALLLGDQAEQRDIADAFELLDTDKSETIDLNELALFMPAIVPGSNVHMLMRHFQKVDANSDYHLNMEEFTDLIKRNIVRDLAIGRIKNWENDRFSFEKK